MSLKIRYERVINASLPTVWEVIVDLPRYKEWNLFCVDCASTLKVGDPIDMKVRLFAFAQSQREYMFTHVPHSTFSYGLTGGALKAIISNRSHTVSAIDDKKTLYVSDFELSGWFMPVVRFLMRSRLEKGFLLMSDGIKRRAELLQSITDNPDAIYVSTGKCPWPGRHA